MMPVLISPNGSAINAIFPAVPSPSHLTVTYQVDQHVHQIDLPLAQIMQGVHLKQSRQQSDVDGQAL